MEALYITGHCLGAAMAVMTALLLRSDPEYDDIFDKLKAADTVGGSMIGDLALAPVVG